MDDMHIGWQAWWQIGIMVEAERLGVWGEEGGMVPGWYDGWLAWWLLGLMAGWYNSERLRGGGMVADMLKFWEYEMILRGLGVDSERLRVVDIVKC